LDRVLFSFMTHYSAIIDNAVNKAANFPEELRIERSGTGIHHCPIDTVLIVEAWYELITLRLL
jgi:hypothetical protein